MIDRSRRVYFAKCIGPTGEPIGAYKIGCSHGWNERVKQLAANLPFTLELEATVPGGRVMEAIVHMRLKEHRIAGEYFHDSDEVREKVEYAAKEGHAFYSIRDTGDAWLPDGAMNGFLAFHGVSLDEVCEKLKIRPKSFDALSKKPRYNNSRVIAAASLIAAARRHFVQWPEDALKGVLGEFSNHLKNEREKAA